MNPSPLCWHQCKIFTTNRKLLTFIQVNRSKYRRCPKHKRSKNFYGARMRLGTPYVRAVKDVPRFRPRLHTKQTHGGTTEVSTCRYSLPQISDGKQRRGKPPFGYVTLYEPTSYLARRIPFTWVTWKTGFVVRSNAIWPNGGWMFSDMKRIPAVVHFERMLVPVSWEVCTCVSILTKALLSRLLTECTTIPVIYYIKLSLKHCYIIYRHRTKLLWSR